MEPIFPSNNKDPDEDDEKFVISLRQAIESYAPDPIGIPLW